MKDIYDFLNDVDLDVSEFENIEVSKKEREKVKRELKKKINRRMPSVWKRTMTAASIAIGISSVSLFGLSFTTFADEIPVIGGIFKLFNDNGLYENYDANANKLNLVQEDKGIKVTIKEAIFDGRIIYVTYEIDSEKELEVRDNLGNVYLDSSVKGDNHRIFYNSITLKKLDPEASSLIITPIAELTKADGKDENGNIYRMINSKAPMESFELAPIIVEIEK
ncbi:DUF4179 domain-containing protein [Robertmurraya massiliosenegalensis]|uniref:DUF4179 domain-containing protein n=1 Tax=Robertmurraya TaxID=2837507 RepID=UPI0039A47024